MHRLLVLRGGALGDFIVTLPALAALRKQWPAARVELVGNLPAATLGLRSGLLDDVHSQHEARWSALYSTAALPAELAAWLTSFDLVLNFWPDPEGELARHFPLRPEQIFLAGAAQPTIGPAAAHFCEPLRSLGIIPASYFYRFPDAMLRLSRLRLQPDCEEREQRRGPRGDETIPWTPADLRPIAIHCGSGSASKNWPLVRWLELTGWLKNQQHAELLIITGDAEPIETRSAFSALGRSVHALPLEELVMTLAGCRYFLGHDSGVSHLAAACGVPSLLLFGPTDPAVWSPPTKKVQWLKKGGEVDAISVESVRAVCRLLIEPKRSASITSRCARAQRPSAPSLKRDDR